MNCVGIKRKQWCLEYWKGKAGWLQIQDVESTWKTVTNGAMSNYIELD